MTRFRLFVALGAAALSLATATAHAANEVELNFHGTICVPASMIGGAPVVYNSYGINNVSGTAPLVVECPIPVTQVLAAPSLHVQTLYVSFFDRGNTRTTCSLNTLNALAVPFNTVTQTSTGPADGAQIMQIDVPSFYGNAFTSFWQLECTIPAVYRNAYSALSAIQVIAAP